MLTSRQIAEVHRLLADGQWSQRDVARMVGISRGSVQLIASGRRKDFGSDAEDESEEPGFAVRCPTCGGKVYAPCRLCRIRNLKAEERPTASLDRRQDPKAWPDARREASSEVPTSPATDSGFFSPPTRR